MAEPNPPEGWQAWHLLSIPALTALGAALPKLWEAVQWLLGRRDKQAEQTQTFNQQMQAGMAAERSALTQGQSDLFSRVLAELTRLEKRLADEEAAHKRTSDDRDDGWDLARFHYRRCGEIVHACNNARTIAEMLAAKHGVEPLVWNHDISMRGFEAPLNRPARE